MLSAHREFGAKVVSSVEEISRADWDSLWPRSAEGYSFYFNQEKAGIPGFDFFYIVCYHEEKPVLIAPACVADFNLALGVEGVVRRVILAIQTVFPKFLHVRTLFCGAPTSERGCVAVHSAYQGQSELIRVFEKEVGTQARARKASFIMCKDMPGDVVETLRPLETLGYVAVESYPATVLATRFDSMEDYFANLSYITRKNMRRKIKKAASLGGVEVEVVNTIDSCADEVYQLYLNTYRKSPIHFECLTKEFFRDICHTMPHDVRYFLYRVHGRLIGFELCVVNGDTLLEKYIGLDYTVSRTYNLYFISTLAVIEWCIKNKKSYCAMGQNTYNVKSKFGATTVPLWAMIKHMNSLMNRSLNFFAAYLGPAG